MAKLRLVKVIIQPVFVIDDGDTLIENVAKPVEVSAALWPNVVAALEEERGRMESDLTDDLTAARESS
jgi:hypothetical protein